MPRPRAPWWMYLCALAFLGQFALVAFSTLYDAKLIGLTRRIPYSIVYEFQSDRLIITGVKPNSAPDRAGVRAGDWLLAINGEPIRSLRELTRVVGNLDIGRTCRLDIERDGRRLQMLIPVLNRSFEWSERIVASTALLGSQFIILILGIVIGFSRPHDAVARFGALMLATMGVLFFVVGAGMISDWRHLPTILGMLLWIPRSAASVVGVIVFVFCACFPRRLLQSTRVMALILVPGVVDGFWNLLAAVDLLYRPAYLERILSLWPSQTHFPIQSAYALAGLAALGANYRHLQDRNDRRRLRVVWAGMAAVVVPTVPVPISDFLPIHASVRAFFVSPAYSILRSVLLIITPSSITYAILRHRLFDIRLMIRRGIQYALARRILVSVVPGLIAILVLDLVLHGNQPLVSILIARGWIYAALGGMVLFARTQRQAWLEALDRRFFREHYDARRILRDIASEVRDSGNFEHIAQRATSRIESALHSEFVTLLTRQDSEMAFQVRPASQLDQAIANLPSGSKLLALLRVLGKPLQISLDETDWLPQQLPQEEILLLRNARIELIIPVVCGAAGPEALLVLGPKHSEEPYSSEDLDLLTTIAANLAMLFEQRTPAPRPMSAAVGDDREPGDASIEASGNKPRLGRTLGPYRVESLLGVGGMGEVYAARDTRLGRMVALKILPAGLAEDPQRKRRFFQEARAASALNHPNIVTLHDVGFDGGIDYLVMEYVQGKTLDKLIPSAGLKLKEALGWAIQISDAFVNAHAAGIVHRDLKPGNIMINEAGLAKVLDFGLAKVERTPDQPGMTQTLSGVVVGTLGYMSPEQAQGEVEDTRSDIFSFGVLLYEMLSGRRPFQGTDRVSTLAAIVNQEPPLLIGVPHNLEKLVHRCLAKDRTQRYQRMLDVKASLEKLRQASDSGKMASA